MKDEPAVGIALGAIIIMLLTSAGLALGDQEKAAITVLASALVPLLQGLLTRFKVYSPLTAEQHAVEQPHTLLRDERGRFAKAD